MADKVHFSVVHRLTDTMYSLMMQHTQLQQLDGSHVSHTIESACLTPAKHTELHAHVLVTSSVPQM